AGALGASTWTTPSLRSAEMRRIRPFPSPFAKRAFRPRSDVRGGHAPERNPTGDGIRVDLDRASGVLDDHSRDGGLVRCEEQRGRPLKLLKSVEVVEGLSERSRIWQSKPSERAGLQGIRPRVRGTFGEVEAEIGVRRAMEVPRALRDVRGGGRSAEVVCIGGVVGVAGVSDGRRTAAQRDGQGREGNDSCGCGVPHRNLLEIASGAYV